MILIQTTSEVKIISNNDLHIYTKNKQNKIIGKIDNNLFPSLKKLNLSKRDKESFIIYLKKEIEKYKSKKSLMENQLKDFNKQLKKWGIN